MIIKSFCFNPIEENTYVVSDDSMLCAIIDPGCSNRQEEQILKEYIDNNKLKPVLLLNTHLHFDHIFGDAFVCNTYGLVTKAHIADNIFLTPQQLLSSGFPEIPLDYNFKIEWINEGDVMTFGQSEFTVLHTPGHSPGSVSYYCSKCKAVFSGDTLFQHSVGRTDLPGGNNEALLDSVYIKLFHLPDDTVIYPGHGLKSTIIDEKTNNPYV